VAEAEVAQVDHLDHHEVAAVPIPGVDLSIAEHRLVLDAEPVLLA